MLDWDTAEDWILKMREALIVNDYYYEVVEFREELYVERYREEQRQLWVAGRSTGDKVRASQEILGNIEDLPRSFLCSHVRSVHMDRCSCDPMVLWETILRIYSPNALRLRRIFYHMAQGVEEDREEWICRVLALKGRLHVLGATVSDEDVTVVLMGGLNIANTRLKGWMDVTPPYVPTLANAVAFLKGERNPSHLRLRESFLRAVQRRGESVESWIERILTQREELKNQGITFTDDDTIIVLITHLNDDYSDVSTWLETTPPDLVSLDRTVEFLRSQA